jgi:hypothetical protein
MIHKDGLVHSSITNKRMAHETISLVKTYYQTCLISSGVKNPFESLSRTSNAFSKISASEDGNLHLKKT